MKNISCLQSQPQKSILEVREQDILDRHNGRNHKYLYPRHISQLESPSHRGYGNRITNAHFLPITCPINSPKEQQEVNMAVEILKYQLSDRKAKQIHLQSVRRNLDRRLQVAINDGNEHLVNQLHQEYQELQLP